jgi:hypothetical protein
LLRGGSALTTEKICPAHGLSDILWLPPWQKAFQNLPAEANASLPPNGLLLLASVFELALQVNQLIPDEIKRSWHGASDFEFLFRLSQNTTKLSLTIEVDEGIGQITAQASGKNLATTIGHVVPISALPELTLLAKDHAGFPKALTLHGLLVSSQRLRRSELNQLRDHFINSNTPALVRLKTGVGA